METENNTSASERAERPLKDIELTQAQYEQLALADPESTDVGDLLALHGIKAGESVILTITQEDGSKVRRVVKTNHDDFFTTDRNATERLSSVEGREGLEVRAGIDTADDLGGVALEAAGAEEPTEIALDEGETSYDSFLEDNQEEEDEREDSEKLKQALLEAKGEYARLTSSLIDDLSVEANLVLGRIESGLDGAKSGVVVAANMLEDDVQALRTLVSNLDNGNYSVEMARSKMKTIVESLSGAYRRVASGAEVYRTLPRQANQLGELLEGTSQALLRTDHSYAEYVDQVSKDAVEEAAVGATLDDTEDIRSDIATMVEMTYEWADISHASHELTDLAASTRRFAASVEAQLQASYRGPVDSYELQLIAAEMSSLLDRVPIQRYTSKDDEGINKIRRQLYRLAE